MTLPLAERLFAFAQAEARHGIGRQRKDLFNEAGDVINGLTARAEAAEKERDEYRLVRVVKKERPPIVIEDDIRPEGRTDTYRNAAWMLDYIENHFPQAFDEAEHALAEWDGKP